MKLSSPVHLLKSQAKKLKKSRSISMSEALNQIALKEGYNSWSLLQAKNSNPYPEAYCEILSFFNNGDLVIIGARPSTGKTSFTIGLFVQAIQEAVGKNYYFTLSDVHRDVIGRIGIYDQSIKPNNDVFELDYSNDIMADYIIEKSGHDIQEGSIIIVDYLQLLDEKRSNPPLQDQIEKLKIYAKEKGCIIIFISQLRREIENRTNKRPNMEDIRLPNPLNLKLFNKILLLFREGNDSKEVDVLFYQPKEHQFRVKWNKEKIQFS